MAVPTDNFSGSSYPSPPPTIRFDVINQAFALFQQQMSQWVVLILVYAIVSVVVAAALSLIPIIGAVLSNIPLMVLSGGLFKAALKQLRGEVVAVGDLFSITDLAGPLIVAGILVNIGVAIGTLLCIVPGLVAAGLWIFTVALIVDRGLDGVAAMRESWNALRSQWLMAGVFYFVVGLVAMAGILACGVGVLFTAPIALLAVALLYRDFFPEDAAPLDAPFVPPTSGL